MSQKLDTKPTDRSSGKAGLNPIIALYQLFGDTKFAIFVIIALAIASIIGVFIVDQVPYRGEMAKQVYADRQNEPLIWVLINLIPERPFSCPGFQTLLALLSLSLVACIIKRWRVQWRRAFSLPPVTAAKLDGDATLAWSTSKPPSESELTGFLKKRWFTYRTFHDDDNLLISGSKWGLSRLGPLFTHLGFLFLVAGGLWMTLSGFSTIIWLRPGDNFEIPRNGARLELIDFQIQRTESGRIADYISHVKLWRGANLIKDMKLEVNKPLRYQGFSFYQSSFRTDPVTVKSIDLLYEATDILTSNSPGDLDDSSAAASVHMGPHDQQNNAGQFVNPATLTLRPGLTRKIPGTKYSAGIDTFLADFRIGENGPFLGSANPENPAVHLNFFAGDSLIGDSWFFLRHPGMNVGSKPEDLSLRFASFDPISMTGLEMATHPGSGIVWAGFAIMTLGTMLSFLLRHEEIWLRIRPQENRWEIAMIHRGASTQDPELVDHPWETSLTSLSATMLKKWASAGGKPSRTPFNNQTKSSRG